MVSSGVRPDFHHVSPSVRLVRLAPRHAARAASSRDAPHRVKVFSDGSLSREPGGILVFSHGCQTMSPRLIVTGNRDDPSNPLMLDGDAIDAAAQDPLAIGKLMVDQVWAEGTDPTGGVLYYEPISNRRWRLQAFETGHEDFMTDGWVRVLATAEQAQRERSGMDQAARAGLVKIHGTHRGVLLVEFLDVPWG